MGMHCATKSQRSIFQAERSIGFSHASILPVHQAFLHGPQTFQPAQQLGLEARTAVVKRIGNCHLSLELSWLGHRVILDDFKSAGAMLDVGYTTD